MTTPISRLKACVALGEKATAGPLRIEVLLSSLGTRHLIWADLGKATVDVANMSDGHLATLFVALRNSIPDLTFVLARLETLDHALTVAERHLSLMAETQKVTPGCGQAAELARAALGSKL